MAISRAKDQILQLYMVLTLQRRDPSQDSFPDPTSCGSRGYTRPVAIVLFVIISFRRTFTVFVFSVNLSIPEFDLGFRVSSNVGSDPLYSRTSDVCRWKEHLSRQPTYPPTDEIEVTHANQSALVAFALRVESTKRQRQTQRIASRA